MYCSNCGKKIDDGSKFCQFCGSAVGGGASMNGSAPALNVKKNPISKNAVIGIAACVVVLLIAIVMLASGEISHLVSG